MAKDKKNFDAKRRACEKNLERRQKEWARRYILDPLTAPEPSQVDGPGSSFFNPKRSLSLSFRYKPKDFQARIQHRRAHSDISCPTLPYSAHPSSPTLQIHHPKPYSPARRPSFLPPTERTSAEQILGRKQNAADTTQRTSYTGRRFDLVASTIRSKVRESDLPAASHTDVRNLRTIQRKPAGAGGVSNPVEPQVQQQPPRPGETQARRQKETSQTTSATRLSATQKTTTRPYLSAHTRARDTTQNRLSKEIRRAEPLSKSQQAKQKDRDLAEKSNPPPPPDSNPRPHKLRRASRPPQTYLTQGTAEILRAIITDQTSSLTNRPPVSPAPVAPKSLVSRLRFKDSSRTTDLPIPPVSGRRSVVESTQSRNMTGRNTVEDMSSNVPSKPRPTSAHKHRSRSNRPYADIIDSLDQTGAVYHHGGPYDAALAAVNRNKKLSPLEAIKDSNREALKATPRYNVRDSLQKHVPLQGTATIPPGMRDANGEIMDYEEGADLMREDRAQGGAYKRWDFIEYKPDDFKGKGEPSFSIERALKERPHRLQRRSSSFSHGPGEALVSLRCNSYGKPLPSSSKQSSQVSTRRRSFSHRETTDEFFFDGRHEAFGGDGGLGRSASRGKSIADGIKRRFGSLRKN